MLTNNAPNNAPVFALHMVLVIIYFGVDLGRGTRIPVLKRFLPHDQHALSSRRTINSEACQRPLEYNKVLINQRRKPFCKPPKPPNTSKQTPCPPPTTPYLLS